MITDSTSATYPSGYGQGLMPTPGELSPSPQLQKFENLLKQSLETKDGSKTGNVKSEHRKELREAARQMEIQLVTMMFKTMEKTSSENGMLGGGKSAGMTHFKDMFFQQVAEEVVESQGLGFAQSLLNNYELNNLKS